MNTDLLFHLLIIASMIVALFFELKVVVSLARDRLEEYASDFYNEESKRENKQGNRAIKKTLRKFDKFFVCTIVAFADCVQQIKLITCNMVVKFLIGSVSQPDNNKPDNRPFQTSPGFHK
jgi:hypothetical protein